MSSSRKTRAWANKIANKSARKQARRRDKLPNMYGVYMVIPLLMRELPTLADINTSIERIVDKLLVRNMISNTLSVIDEIVNTKHNLRGFSSVIFNSSDRYISRLKHIKSCDIESARVLLGYTYLPDHNIIQCQHVRPNTPESWIMSSVYTL